MDNFIYGIHCPKYINISSGVNRAILAAISDLSAMAAKPYSIFISITLNKDNISTKLLKDLKIPLPPLEIQKEIVDELEQYQEEIEHIKF